MVSSAEMPIELAKVEKTRGDGSVCGSAEPGSTTTSWSKKTARGMCPASYSALPLRCCVGRYQDASTTERPGSLRCSASHSVVTKKELFSLICRSGTALHRTTGRLRCCMFDGARKAGRHAPGAGLGTPASGGRQRAEADAEPAVLPALLLDLADVNLANLACGDDVGAPAGLGVHAAVSADEDEPDAPGARRRAHVLRLHQPGIGRQLLLGDPAAGHRMVAAHQLHQPRGHLLPGVACIRDVEIHPALLLADCGTRDRIGADDGEQMAGRVHAHQLQPAVPVDLEPHGLADLRHWASLGRNMNDVVLALAGHRAGNRDARTIGPNEKAGVARLPARRGVEDGAVEHDAACAIQVGHLGVDRKSVV